MYLAGLHGRGGTSGIDHAVGKGHGGGTVAGRGGVAHQGGGWRGPGRSGDGGMPVVRMTTRTHMGAQGVRLLRGGYNSGGARRQ